MNKAKCFAPPINLACIGSQILKFTTLEVVCHVAPLVESQLLFCFPTKWPLHNVVQ